MLVRYNSLLSCDAQKASVSSILTPSATFEIVNVVALVERSFGANVVDLEARS